MASKPKLIDWIHSVDPALSRARMGARVTLSIALSVGVLVLVHLNGMALPPIAFGLAIILSIEGGVAVRDATPRGQLLTRALGALAALASMSSAIALEQHRYLSDITFLLIVLFASLARVYGPRGFAIGMFAFTSYFISAYLNPTYDQLPGAAFALVVAALVSHGVRSLLLPDNRGRDLLQALIAMQGRANDILVRLALLAREHVTTDEDRAELVQLQERLKEVSLMAEGLLPRNADGMLDESDAGVMEIATAIFDLHLATESAVVLSVYNTAPFGLVHAVLEGKDEAVSHWSELRDETPDKHLRETINAFTLLHRIRTRFAGVIAEGMHDQFRTLAPHTPDRSGARPDFSLKNPLVRAALQITVASGIAMVFGLMLSRERWFWAVLTAFLVFTNTKSRGDTAIRALQRSIGTVLGIAAGLCLASLIKGDMVASVAVAGLGIFCAFYALQASYAVMTFFVSIVICVIYGLIGSLTTELLLLRVEETLIGAVAGTAVAFVVFPARTRETLEGAIGRWYDQLGQLLESARAGASGNDLMERSRQLDLAYRDLAQAARPIGTSWSIVTKPGHVRQTLAIFLGCTYWARMFARGQALPAHAMPAEDVEAVSALLEKMSAARALSGEPFYRASKVRRQTLDHLPTYHLGARQGLDMIGILLGRLTPPRRVT
ncbi:FUSC family protein [Rhizobium straminoryzae]|uniref:FUSC family protein n=1 Tax=Rhizobium straminoryzae TaxID=1387186 RepID=A0A549TG72_9HYPH|nr:FUSC family protein [Rhizobium straminoryzae]TRL41571.1 FUSC family protein [Rhizobium straminoryzae]